MSTIITKATPKDDYTLEIFTANNNRLMCDMKPYLDTILFCPLRDMETWKQIEIMDTCLIWRGKSTIELSIDRLLDLFIKGKSYNRDVVIDSASIQQEWILHVILANSNWMDMDFRQLFQYPLFSPLIEKGLWKTMKANRHSFLWKNSNVSLEISMHMLLNYFI